MIRSTKRCTPILALLLTGALMAADDASHQAAAQGSSILAEVYGRGVHSFYAGRYDEAYNQLSAAIDGGSRDPRAYYFRGIVAQNQGRTYEAEADWMQGAQLEARSGTGSNIGRALSRFQGSARLKLEQIRQKARLEALTSGLKRSDARMQQLGVQPSAPTSPMGAAPAAVTPAPAAPAADNPFVDDGVGLSTGSAEVESANALEGLDVNPFEDEAPVGGAEAAPTDGGDGGGIFEEAPADAPGGGIFDTPAGDDDIFGGF